MKKLTAMLLLSMIALLLTAAAADTYTVDGYYTIEYPDSLTVDDTTYLYENNEWVMWMFLLQGEDFVIDAYISVVQSLPGFTLFGADEEGVQAYAEEAMRILEGQNPELLEIIIPESGVPFYEYHLENEYGAYLFAETIVDGKTVNFIAYYADRTAPDDELRAQLEAVVHSYTPVDADMQTVEMD